MFDKYNAFLKDKENEKKLKKKIKNKKEIKITEPDIDEYNSDDSQYSSVEV